MFVLSCAQALAQDVFPSRTVRMIVGFPPGDFVLWDARQNHAVARGVGALGIVRVDIDELVASPGVVFTEVQEGWSAETVGEFPSGQAPVRPVVPREGELGIAAVAEPCIEHAFHHEHAAGLVAARAIAH